VCGAGAGVRAGPAHIHKTFWNTYVFQPEIRSGRKQERQASFQIIPVIQESILTKLVSTRDYTIKYGGISTSNALKIDGYADADWGNDLLERKSISGRVVMMNGGPISWGSNKQQTVALSTGEAELMAICDAAREILAHLMFFQTLSIQIPPPIIFTDNKAAESIVKRQEANHRQSKHIDIRYHFVRDHQEKGTFIIQHIPGDEQLADIFAKPLPRIRHHALVQALRLN
jgi:hypothetical protein